MKNILKVSIGRKQFFTTSELESRYGIKNKAKNERLKALHIRGVRQGRSFVINAEQLKLMDELDAHLKAGGTIKKFVQLCINSGKIVLPQNQTEAIVLAQSNAEPMMVYESQQQESVGENKKVTFLALPQETTTSFEKQRYIKLNQSDFENAIARSEYKAAIKILAEETINQMMEATEDFTIPGLKEELDRHCQNIKQLRLRLNCELMNSWNELVSQTIQSHIKAAGIDDSMRSPKSNSRQSST